MRPLKKMRFTVFGTLAAASTLLLAACGGQSGPASADTAKFVYDVGSASSTVAMAPYTAVPAQMGYWKNQDLDVDVVFSKGSAAALQSVLGGSADIAVSGSNTTYSSAIQNPDLRIVSFTPGNVWRIAVSNDSPITAVEDLKGKSIGVISMTSGSYMYGRSIVKSVGLDPDKDVEWLPIGDGTQATEAIESGRVAAYSSYDGPLDVVGQLTKEGLRPLPAELDRVEGSLAYVVTAETLEKRPEQVEKFLRGTYEGMEFARTNPAAAIQIYWGDHKEQKPTGVSDDEAIASTIETTTNSWKNRASAGDDGIWGYLSPEHIQEASAYFAKHKIVEGKADPELTVDMSITKKASEFDADKIKEEAKSWKP